MDFLLASKNKKKLIELQRILSPLGINVISEADSDFKFPDVDETGSTFAENAYLKAKSACDVCKIPTLADDSGLCVDALDGAPGIYSARFAGEEHDDQLNNDKLLYLLKDVPDDKRTARFVCTLCCCFPDGRSLTVDGQCEGMIAREPSGHSGFGYDPLFVCNGRSLAELSDAEKDKISHRGNALRELAKQLKTMMDKGEF